MNYRLTALPAAVKPALALILLTILGLAVPGRMLAAGTWTAVSTTAPGTVSLMLLLTDGTIMCQNSGNTGWYRLTPDNHGSYVNGTWSTLKSMNYSRRYYSSQVLQNGQVFVAGGEYGAGGPYAEIYDPVANAWTVAPQAPDVDNFIDSISETLPNGNVLIAPVTPDTYGGTVIWNVVSNSWTAGPALYRGDDQDEAAWVKLADQSILTIDPFGTNSERYIPAVNKWINDASVPVVMYGYGGELGPGFLLPNGNAFYIGATNHTAIYTPSGTTNAGVWSAGAAIPNNLGAVDAPAAMMASGNILCALGTDTNFGSVTYFYEYNYVTNSFVLVSSPTGGTSATVSAYGTTMLDLPDGTVLLSGFGAQLYDYKPSGAQLTNAPVISSVTTNSNGSLLVTGTQLTGISEGAAYGDDAQMASDYPIGRITNSTGETFYCRSTNWSVYSPMAGTNVVTADLTLPAGLLAGTYPLIITANGISSLPYTISTAGTPLPPPASLRFTVIASNQMAFRWNAINLTEAGYVVQRSTDGASYFTIASLPGTMTNYTDNTVAPLGQYYYQVFGTNSVGPGGSTSILAASPAVVAVPVPLASRDVGVVSGPGASGTSGATFALTGTGSIVAGATNDQFQYAFQPIAGDQTFTARITTSQATGPYALAGVMLRNSPSSDAPCVVMGYEAGSQTTVFGCRTLAGSNLVASPSSPIVSLPVWVRVMRTGNTFSGYTSADGTNWIQQGTVAAILPPVMEAGLAVSSGVSNLLNTSTFDNVTETGTPAVIPPPMAEWKLDETSGTNAEDSVDSFDGIYNNVLLGQTGASAVTGYSAGFNGTSANITIPPLNLNSNVLTITAWINPSGSQSAWSGIFFDRESSTANGLNFGTANELRYTWNNNANTYSWNSQLVPPANQWSFVALVITPTNAVIGMFANGVLSLATNTVANTVQGFSGSSCIGQDTSSSSRYFKGLMDQVQFYGQALNARQLAELGSTPVISFSTPVSGTGFAAPGSVNFAATLSATNGHAANLVQFFNGSTLVGESSTPPYTNTVTNLGVGTYNLVARLYYDSGLTVDSDPDVVVVENLAGVPRNVAATALASNLVNVVWSPGTNATGYILSRDGNPIATLAGTSYADYGLASGVDYCYSVTATNLVSTSAGSASSCVITPASGASLTWSASGTVPGPQDGNGAWSTNSAMWWNGSANVPWTDTNIAVLGVNTVTNCTVTITNTITPSGIVFNVTGGGTYTLAGTNNILTSSNLNLTADGNAMITGPFFGTNNLIKTGSGTLTLSNSSPHFVGTVTISNGSLVMPTGPSADSIGFVVGTNGALYLGYANGGGYTKGIVIEGGGLNSASGLYIANGITVTEQTFALSNAPTLITSYGSGNNAAIQGFDINSDNLLVAAAASGSVMDASVNINVAGTYGMRIDTLSGANTASGDFVVNGLLVGGVNPLYKYGTGSLRLTGANTYGGGTIVDAGSLQLAGNQSPLGTGSVNYNANGTLQAVVSVSLNNNFSIASGDTMTVDTLTNFLVVNGAITNSGKLTKINSGTLALGGANTYTGATTVSAGTLQVDGSMGGTVVTVANGATLAGTGILNTAPTLQSGSILNPGDAGLGRLAFNTSLTLNGGSKTILELSKNGGALTNGSILAGGTFTRAGTLTVTNMGTNAFVAGDSFQVYSAASYAGNFSAMNLPALTAGLLWNTNSLISSGWLSVVAIPVITNQPQSLFADPGSPASFSVGVAGSATLSFQWQQNGVSVAGATANPLIIPSVSAGNSGSYAVVVTNNFGSATSQVATLVMNIPPVIGTVVLQGGGFSLSGTAAPGETCVLSGATNLVPPVVWLPVETNSADTNGILNFVDPAATNFPQRFYRLGSQ